MKAILGLFRPRPNPEHGERITLEFQCGHTITNTRPPMALTAKLRQTALDQAMRTQCPDCASWLWAGTGPLWQPELQLALKDARKS